VCENLIKNQLFLRELILDISKPLHRRQLRHLEARKRDGCSRYLGHFYPVGLSITYQLSATLLSGSVSNPRKKIKP
jgi:hypothetical protein